MSFDTEDHQRFDLQVFQLLDKLTAAKAVETDLLYYLLLRIQVNLVYSAPQPFWVLLGHDERNFQYRSANDELVCIVDHSFYVMYDWQELLLNIN